MLSLHVCLNDLDFGSALYLSPLAPLLSVSGMSLFQFVYFLFLIEDPGPSCCARQHWPRTRACHHHNL